MTSERMQGRTGEDIADWEAYVDQYASMYKPQSVKIESMSTALLVVDVQKKACDPTSERGMIARLQNQFPQVAEAYIERLRTVTLPNIGALLAAFREARAPIVFFTVGPQLKDGRDLPASFRQQYAQLHDAAIDRTALDSGAAEYAIIDGLEPRQDELVYNKVTRSAFTGSAVELALRSMGVTSVVVVGGRTDVCVHATGCHASDLGFGTVLVEDACHSAFPELHGATMASFQMGIGRVTSTRTVIRELMSQRTA